MIAIMRPRLLALVLLVLPLGAHAQTEDLVFANWSFRTRDTGSRPAGLGGAYVALADGVRAVTSNPAGLALIPDTELSASTADLWAGGARVFKPAAITGPDCGRRRARPFAVALFAEQAVTAGTDVSVVLGPERLAQGRLESSSEQVGVSFAKGVLPWLNAGVTVAWRHLRLDGVSSTLDLDDRELQRFTLGGDANKARLTAGLLATFGPASSPTAFRLGASWQGDVRRWRLERTSLDRQTGVVTGPARIEIAEPTVVSAGAAWRASDVWMVTAQVDRVQYGEVLETLRDELAHGVTIASGLEPRLGIEGTWPSPIGGYFKVRAGVRRETTGRLEYDGADAVLTQAFRRARPAFRASGGMSLLGEFYERAFRLDVDVSQIALDPSSTLAAAGLRRISIGLTARP